MGHSSLSNTLKYLHVQKLVIDQVINPLDKLETDEFIRGFLLHILPQGFFKVRYHGIFANTRRRKNIVKAKELIHFSFLLYTTNLNEITGKKEFR